MCTILNFEICISQDNNALYAEDKERQRGYNEVTDNKLYSNSINLVPATPPAKQCSPAALQAMGNRLLDWFSVVMADSTKRRRSHVKSKGNKISMDFSRNTLFTENQEFDESIL